MQVSGKTFPYGPEELNRLLSVSRQWLESLAPFLNRHPELKEAVTADLMVLANICAYADGVYCEREMIFLALCSLPLCAPQSPEWAALSSEIRAASAYDERWTKRLVQYPAAYRVSNHEKKYNPARMLQTICRLKELGENETGIQPILEAFRSFADSFMKADGRVPLSEEAVLHQVNLLLDASARN